MTRALMIGGTGPTEIHVVRGLVERGHDVPSVHRGLHERDETPPEVRHRHCDPYDDADLTDLFESETFDLEVAMYRRLQRALLR